MSDDRYTGQTEIPSGLFSRHTGSIAIHIGVLARIDGDFVSPGRDGLAILIQILDTW